MRAAIKMFPMSGLLFFTACGRAGENADIRSVLDRQVVAWNHGDIEGFMQGYWKSDQLEFSTPDSTTRGWQATLDRYRKRYPTREAMGTLRFERLVVVRTTPETAEVSGRYRVKTATGEKSGRFNLKMRRMDGSWVIVRDETIADS